MNSQKIHKKLSYGSSSESIEEYSTKVTIHSQVKTKKKPLRNIFKTKKDLNKLGYVKFKFKYPKIENKPFITKSTMEDNERTVTQKQITTGKGLAVPLCEGEEIVINRSNQNF